MTVSIELTFSLDEVLIVIKYLGSVIVFCVYMEVIFITLVLG